MIDFENLNDYEKYYIVKTNWRRFLKYCKINDAHKGTIDFEEWPHVVRLFHLYDDYDYVIIAKAKQIGVSISAALRALWKSQTASGYTALIISAGERESTLLLNKAKFAWQHLPGWLQLKPDKWSDSEISFPYMNSRILALPSTETPGLGFTASEVYLDEWDFHKYPEADFRTAEATTSAGGKIIGMSTINQEQSESFFRDQWAAARSGVNNFYPVFLSCYVRPDRGEEWYENERRNYIGREHDFTVNYPKTEKEAFSLITGRMFFDGNVLATLLENPIEPMESRYDCIFMYSKFQPSWCYAFGADISQGIGSDYQSAVLLGKRGNTIEDVAYIHANDMGEKTFAFYTEQLGKEYNYPIVGGEANAMGLSYLRELQEIRYHNLFFRDEKREQLGWWTSKDNKQKLLIDLNKALSDGLLVIRYKPLLNQLLEFQHIESRGEIKLKSVGKHDDLVMALAIAYQMIKDMRPKQSSKRPVFVENVVTKGM